MCALGQGYAVSGRDPDDSSAVKVMQRAWGRAWEIFSEGRCSLTGLMQIEWRTFLRPAQSLSCGEILMS